MTTTIPDMALPETKLSEIEKVELWREHVLIEAEFSPEVASLLAANHGVDLHRAVELKLDGCDEILVAGILL
jgi:hypothetical protein